MTRPVRVALTVFAEPVAAEPEVPAGAVPLADLLPAMYEVDNQLIAAAVRYAESGGKTVSCQKGCSACCRAQPVPVTPAEAYALWRLVEGLPEPRRAEVTGRFADRVRRLEANGLADLFRRLVPITSAAHGRQAAQAYFRLGLVCPFLEADACSIHPHRPFVCRQYLVTSDPKLCADPFAHKADVVPFPPAPATALLAASETFAGRPQLTVPLVLALDYAERNRAELERAFDGEAVFRGWADALTRTP